jgi:hypothetical protein
MTKNSNTRPHSPNTPARKSGRVATTHRPRPFYKKGGRLVVCPRRKATVSAEEKLGGWIPPALRLPDTIEGIEAGRQEQRSLLPAVVPDDTRQGRLGRLLAAVPGATTADRVELTR